MEQGGLGRCLGSVGDWGWFVGDSEGGYKINISNSKNFFDVLMYEIGR